MNNPWLSRNTACVQTFWFQSILTVEILHQIRKGINVFIVLVLISNTKCLEKNIFLIQNVKQNILLYIQNLSRESVGSKKIVSCKCLTKILALNTKWRKKYKMTWEKFCFETNKVYWKVLLLIQTDSRKILLWNKRFL